MDKLSEARMRVGIAVYCTTCNCQKNPRGRSAPLGVPMCDWDCKGYDQDPRAGDLWPGETEKDFGYPIGPEGTRELTEEEEAINSTYMQPKHEEGTNPNGSQEK